MNTNVKWNPKWTAYDVMNWCINRNFYTWGSSAEYERMLDFVRNNLPTKKNVRLVAIDVICHSDPERYSIFEDGDIDALANEIWNEVVTDIRFDY